MPKYTLSDIPIIETYGRKETFETFFGGYVPEKENLLSLTFEQILMAGGNGVSFSSVGQWSIFGADKPWITMADFEHMLSGKFLSVPNRNDNLLRIETLYKFLFKNVALLRNGELEFVKGEADRDLDAQAFGKLTYGLILGSYGQYNWNEVRKYKSF